MARWAGSGSFRVVIVATVITLGAGVAQPGLASAATKHPAKHPAATHPARHSRTTKTTTTQAPTPPTTARRAPTAPVAATAAGCQTSQVVSAFSFVIDGVTMPRLRGNARSGSQVSAAFTVAPGCSAQVTLKSFTAPSGSFQPGNGKLEKLFDSRTRTVAAGRFTLGPIRVPGCFFEVDLTVGPFPNRAGQDFRVDSATGGTTPCGSAPAPGSPGPVQSGAPAPHLVRARHAARASTVAVRLAVTGAGPIGPMLALAGFLMLLGTGLVAATRRRDVTPSGVVHTEL